MSFQPQNPFEFVEQMLMNAGQTVSQGFGRGIQAREQRAAAQGQAAAEAAQQQALWGREDAQTAAKWDREDTQADLAARRAHGINVQGYAGDTLTVIRQLMGSLGDEDPALSSALSSLAGELERGIMSDPVHAAELIGNARAQLQRRQVTTEAISFPGDVMMGGEAFQEGTRTALRRTERTTTEEFTPGELIAYSAARVGNLEYLRSLSEDERQAAADMAMKEFESALIAGRQETQSNFDFGRSLVTSAREALSTLQTVRHMMSPEMLERYESQVHALQILATQTPQGAYDIYSKSSLSGGEGQDVYLALAEISGLAQTLTNQQTRYLNRFDNLVERIQDNESINPEQAKDLLENIQMYLPEYAIDQAEIAMVREYLGLETVLFSARDYADDPARMATGLSIFTVMGEGGTVGIDMARLQERNPELYTAYMAYPGEAEAALTDFFMQRSIAQHNMAESISEAARSVLGTGIGYSQLSPEARVEVKRALGRPSAGDAWAMEELSKRAQLAAQAGEAAHRASLANAEIAALGLDAKLTEWAQAGNYGALVAYRQADPTRASNADLDHLITQARAVHQANIDMVRYDAVSRGAASREALRKAQNGEYLNDVERAALQAQFELDRDTAVRDLGMLGLQTHGEVANLLSGIAEVVPAEWWDEVTLPATIRDSMEAMGLKPALQAISRSSQYALDSDLRDDVRGFVLNLADIIPASETEATALIYAARTEMTVAGFSDAVQDGFVRFLEGSWKLLEERERRADSADQLGWENNAVAWANNAVSWANHHLRAQELARSERIDDAKNVISLVDGLVDNQRQALTQEQNYLVSIGCAKPSLGILGGPDTMMRAESINDGPMRGQSCAILTDGYVESFRQFETNAGWHQDLVNAFASEYGLSSPGVQDYVPDLTGARVRPIADLSAASRWDRDYSADNLSAMSAVDLLEIAAGLGAATSTGDYGRAGEANVQRLYGRVWAEVVRRFGDKAEEYARKVIGQ